MFELPVAPEDSVVPPEFGIAGLRQGGATESVYADMHGQKAAPAE